MLVIEKTFGFVSTVTMFELSNTNNELLRRLSEVAPGTFQHSITVGNLATEIASRIGAKGQLVRTGALYHDIGKMLNPAFFTENQAGINPHDKLNDLESARIIISHVTEGLKLAEKYNLPREIKELLPPIMVLDLLSISTYTTRMNIQMRRSTRSYSVTLDQILSPVNRLFL